ncbi:hypothetical protein FIU91_01370 [Roseivivax sp. THAF30]|nr:hypothetical protein FIU91_01370 [Roseivivax sp. THAF30]
MLRLSLCAALTLGASGSYAEIYKIENIGTGDLRGSTDGLNFSYDVHLRLETLLREPVVGTRFRWRLNPNFSEFEVSELISDERRRVKLLNVPREAQLKARIYDVDIEFEMSGATGVYYLLADGGDPGPGDGETWSFNVPGSPDWDELFYRTPLDGPNDRADYVSESEAKRIWKEGLRLHTARLVDVKVSTHDLVRWYVQQSKKPEIEVTKKAIRNLAAGIQQGFGYEIDPEEFAEVTPEERWDTEGMSNLPEEEGLRAAEIDYKILSERLGKLLAMPKKFEPTGDLILFDAAVAELRSDIAELADKRTDRGLRDYPLALGLSPREFEEGRDIVTKKYRLLSIPNRTGRREIGDEDYFYSIGNTEFAIFDSSGRQLTLGIESDRISLILDKYVVYGDCIYDLETGDIITTRKGGRVLYLGNSCNKRGWRADYLNIFLEGSKTEAKSHGNWSLLNETFNAMGGQPRWATIEINGSTRIINIGCDTIFGGYDEYTLYDEDLNEIYHEYDDDKTKRLAERENLEAKGVPNCL